MSKLLTSDAKWHLKTLTTLQQAAVFMVSNLLTSDLKRQIVIFTTLKLVVIQTVVGVMWFLRTYTAVYGRIRPYICYGAVYGAPLYCINSPIVIRVPYHIVYNSHGYVPVRHICQNLTYLKF